MLFKLIIVTCVIQTCFSRHCYDCGNEYTRAKRAKYSYPPRFFRKPPMSYPIRGPYSYTPPPGYMEDADTNSRPPGPPGPPGPPYKVSKRKEGLGEEDFNNLIRYLSKQDLDRIVELAGERLRPTERFRSPNEQKNAFDNSELDFDPNKITSFNNGDNSGPPEPYKVSKHKESLKEEDFSDFIKYLSKQDLEKIVELSGGRDRNTDRFRVTDEQTKSSGLDFSSQIIPFTNDDQRPSNIEYSNPQNYVQLRPENSFVNSQVNTYLDTEESRQSSQISYITQYQQNELSNGENYMKNEGDIIFTDSKTMKEEQLPKPLNLRESPDYEASHTNNVPSVVKAESYKLENFAHLPLMNYEHSKLETVNSYSVPHYTVTSTRNQVSPPPAPSLPIIPAISQAKPSALSAAQQQSDAHLKATKIWTHKSTGTAYTLHDDGTLSLERPIGPRQRF